MKLNEMPRRLEGWIFGPRRTVRIRPRFPKRSATITVPADSHRSVMLGSVAPASDHPQETHHLGVATVGLGLAGVGAFGVPTLSLLSVPLTLYVARPVFRSGYRAVVKEGRPRLSIIDSIAIGGTVACHFYLASAVGSWLCTLSDLLVRQTEDKTKDGIIKVFGQQPSKAWRLDEDGAQSEIPLKDLGPDDVIVVNAGEMIPIDGVVDGGLASVDQRALTGEAQPAEKEIGESVFAATTVVNGRLRIRVEKTGQETVAAQIGKILNDTLRFRSTLESRADRIGDRTVIPTLGAGYFALHALGPTGALAAICSNFSINTRIASPLGMLNFLNTASKNAVLIKDGRSLETLNSITTVVFDKTGTLTLEQPTVSNIHPVAGTSEEALLKWAACAEYRQSHPIARALIEAAKERGIEQLTPDHTDCELGYGLKVQLAEGTIRVGSSRYMELEQIQIPEEIQDRHTHAHAEGNTMVFVALDDRLRGAIELQPTLRPEARDIIGRLRQRNLSLAIISGDHERPTRHLSEQLGMDRYFAEVLPEDKARHVEQLQAEGKKVCFVGDGINDTIALKTADVSISMSGASTVATDCAQIVLMDGTLNHLEEAFEYSRGFQRNLKKTLITTFAPGLACLGGVFFMHFRIFAAMMLYQTSLVASVANAMSPVMKLPQSGATGSPAESN